MNMSGLDLVLKSIDLSFDWRKLALAILGIIATVLGGGLFVWIGNQLAGVLGLLFGLVGLLVAMAINALFMGAITRLSYDDLAGQPTLRGLTAALLDAVPRLPTLFLSPLLLVLGVVAVIIVEAVLLLLGRIPFLGEIIVALVFLPLILINAFLFIVVAASTWLIIPIAVAENAGVMPAIQRAIDLTRRAPGRIVIYLIITTFLAFFIVVGVGLLLLLAYSVTLSLTVTGMSFQRAIQMGLSGFMSLLGPMGGLLFYNYGGFGGFRDIPITMTLANLLITLETFVLWFGVVFALPRVFTLTAAGAVYLNVVGQAPAPQPQPMPQQPPAWTPPTPAPASAPAPAPAAAGWPPPPASSYSNQPVQPAATYTPPSAYTPTVQASPAYTPPPVSNMPPAVRLCVSCGKPLANPSSRFCQACGARQP
jgi:hypothetical protein